MSSTHPSATSEVASLAAHVKWATCPDRTAATAAARASFAARWERQVDPDGTLDPAIRAERAAEAKRAHFAELALKSADVRRAKAAARKAAGNAA
ncbi:hypothetical protein [Micromonospora sp. HUAS LYJ1]|uniref:hypothetical protein n=1 Tax=Micromonospora sp. HUAS LYJ1 TaxID=3061626 RepID=UPI002670E832|nr:hypothetical protein [Micromonospora sp. HUAS LYJ1]WKU03862.1 hypothetical protein Q2K16_23930 [Micromonospora sp. HUAS LYJ1]